MTIKFSFFERNALANLPHRERWVIYEDILAPFLPALTVQEKSVESEKSPLQFSINDITVLDSVFSHIAQKRDFYAIDKLLELGYQEGSFLQPSIRLTRLKFTGFFHYAMSEPDPVLFDYLITHKNIPHIAAIHSGYDKKTLSEKEPQTILPLTLSGDTVLSLAIGKNKFDFFKKILEKAQEIYQTAPADNSYIQNTSQYIVNTNQSTFSSCDLTQSLFQQDNEGANLLHRAAYLGASEHCPFFQTLFDNPIFQQHYKENGIFLQRNSDNETVFDFCLDHQLDNQANQILDFVQNDYPILKVYTQALAQNMTKIPLYLKEKRQALYQKAEILLDKASLHETLGVAIPGLITDMKNNPLEPDRKNSTFKL